MGLELVKPMARLKELTAIRAAGSLKGQSTGFSGLDHLYTARRGFPLFVAGAPHHGKSILVKQMAVNWAMLHDWRILLYLGEEGSADDLIADLVEMVVGMDLRLTSPGGLSNTLSMTEEQLLDALVFVDQHFRIICPDEVSKEPRFNLADFQRLASSEVFDATVLDPWNDLDHDVEGHGGREDIYLAHALRDVRRACRDANRLDVVVTHVAKIHADKKTDDGKRYQGPAMPTEWAGGQTWYRRAFTMLLVYRPPAGYVIEPDGNPIEPGEAWVYCQKTKPKGVGALGRVKLWWRPHLHRFEEMNEAGDYQGPSWL